MAAARRAVADVGESGLISLLSSKLGSPPAGQIWSGDDAAVVEVPSGRLVLTTDVIVEDVDFRLATFGPVDIGWKAMAVNISDIAAMGGVALYALATISLRKDTALDVFEGVSEGLFEAAASFDVTVVGGDISEAKEMTVGVSLVGVVTHDAVTRSGARVGDAICVTGTLGGAAGGLLALARDEDHPALLRRQRHPVPRAAEGPALARSGVTSMIDLSDGLAVDLGHIVEASGVGCEVDLATLPLDPGLAGLTGIDATELAVTGGEDFELLFTTGDVEAARAAAGATEITRIGVVTDGEARIGSRALEEWRDGGWEHLLDR